MSDPFVVVVPGDVPAMVPGTGPVDLGSVVLGELASLALVGVPLGLVLQRVAQIAGRAIPGAVAVSVTVVRGRSASSAGFTGAVAAALDERQYAAGFGPCLDAASSATEVVIADTASSAVYPGFGALAVHHGVGSVVALGLAVAGPVSAALNVYRAGPSAGDQGGVALTTRVARVFAVYAAVVVSNAAAMEAERATSAQLGAAMVSRAGIEQAKGVLMSQRGISAQAAFDVLAASSQDANVKLAVIAAGVLAATASVPATSGGAPAS